ncbi:unnamed protein product, partial [Staurois parvus]
FPVLRCDGCISFLILGFLSSTRYFPLVIWPVSLIFKRTSSPAEVSVTGMRQIRDRLTILKLGHCPRARDAPGTFFIGFF